MDLACPPAKQRPVSEVFGEENFQANISWQKRYTRSNNTVDFTTVVEYLLVYSKSEQFSVNLLERTSEADARYLNPDNDPRGPWKGASFLNPATPQQRRNLCYPIRNPNTGEVTNPTTNAWRRSSEEFYRLQREERLYWGATGSQPVPAIKMFLSEARKITPINLEITYPFTQGRISHEKLCIAYRTNLIVQPRARATSASFLWRPRTNCDARPGSMDNSLHSSEPGRRISTTI